MDVAAMLRIGIAMRAYERTEAPLRRLEGVRLAGNAVLMLVFVR